MKKNHRILILLLTLSSIFAACNKDKTEPSELSKLPLATQTGAGIFGCLVNGKAWVAETDCKFLCDAPFKIYYDAGYGGNLFIKATRYNSKLNVNDLISLSFDSTDYKLIQMYSSPMRMILSYKNYIIPNVCASIESYDSTVFTSGFVNVTKYDLQTGIISGTFNMSLERPGCEKIVITDGRFDKNL